MKGDRNQPMSHVDSWGESKVDIETKDEFAETWLALIGWRVGGEVKTPKVSRQKKVGGQCFCWSFIL